MKQETLEEAAENYAKPFDNRFWVVATFKDGAKWEQDNSNINALNFEIDALKRLVKVLEHQQERMYSEEEVDKLISDFKHDLRESTSNYVKQNCEGAIFGLERLKQFKKEDKQ